MRIHFKQSAPETLSPSDDLKKSEWMDSREREKIVAVMARYDYLRQILLHEVKSLKNYLPNKSVYHTLVDNLEEEPTEASPETVKSAQTAILELTKVMSLFKPELDAARALKLSAEKKS